MSRGEPSLHYRSDIDGLRAVAVVSIVVFHFSKAALPNGFLGVDIFFVLSGYLITSILWRETIANSFSIAGFYLRRVRRILPVLLVALVVTTIVALLLLLPADLVGYGKSVIATLGFVANVYFWRDGDYFSRIAEEKPLLHMWSLGVEEQFYIIFPVLLVACLRRSYRLAFLAVAIVTFGSLVANALLISRGGGNPAFYLSPTRAWQLGAGALIALLPASARLRPATSEILAIAGLMLVAIALGAPDRLLAKSTLAMAAVAGAALLIVAGRHDRPFVGKILSLRPMVFIGLISFSLYLWHWPVIVFGKYYLVREFTTSELVGAIAVMGLLSVASWRYVEVPFRRRTLPIPTLRWFVGGNAAVLIAVAAACVWSQGFPGRLNGQAAIINQAVGTNYRCPVQDYIVFGASRACLLNLPSRAPQDADIVLVGNSHAQMYAPLWEGILRERKLNGLLVPLNECLPTTQANVIADCLSPAKVNLAEILKLRRIKTVVLGLTWQHTTLVDEKGTAHDNKNGAALIGALDRLIEDLKAAGKKVVLIGPIAQPEWDVASIVSRQMAFGYPIDRPLFRPQAEFDALYGPAIEHFANRSDIAFVRPDKVQCNDTRCDYLLDGRSLFADSNHIAAAELYRFRAMFEGALDRSLRP